MLRIRHWKIGVILLLFALPSGRAAALESFTATVSFYQGVSLASGMTAFDPTVLTLIIGSAQEIDLIAAPDISPLFTFPPSSDLFVALAADQTTPMLLTPLHGAQVAALALEPLASLTPERLAALDYTAQPVTIDATQMIAARLDDGIYRILGPMTLNADATVTFTVWTPETGSVPEPGTFVLFAVGILGVWRIFTRITQHQQKGNSMNVKNLSLIIFTYLLLSANAVAAAKVTVVKIGTGNGEVEGEGFHCGSTCQKEYPENTVLQLKAIPEEDSRFVEWMVNGVRQEGTIRVSNKDMIISARFEMLDLALPEFAVWWYDGNDVSAAFVARDEIVVKFDEQQLQEEEKLQQAIETVKQRFTSSIEIRDVEDFDDFIVWFQISPIASFGEFEAISKELKQLSFIKQVNPVLYRDIEDRNHWLVPTGEILVEYPATSTEAQIDSFEAKYHLVQSDEGEQLFPRTFTYRVENPLNALECSRQVYESGEVIYSWPVLMKPIKLLDDVPLNQDDPFLDAQWNFRGESEHGGSIFDAWALTRNNLSIQGTGVTIGIVEPGGVYIEHEDLIENVNRKLSSEMNRIDKLSFVQKLPPEKPKKHHSASHGTSTAGVAAGRGANGIGISGVAPRAAIAAYGVGADPRAAAKAFTIRRTDVDIYSNSWEEDRFLDRDGMSTIDEAMQTGTKGGNGKNNIFVWAAGNERKNGGNANYFARANSHYAIAVAAAGKTGIYQGYSNPGANVLINAPVPSCTTDLPGDEGYNPWGLDLRSLGNYVLTSLTFEQLQQEQIPESLLQQLQTLKDHEFYSEEKFLAALQQQIGEEQLKIYQGTLLYYAYHSLKFRVDGLGEFENKNYTRDFAGTSAATPFVAGVIALMRQANPSLTYRDVRAILIRTAFRNQYDDPEYTGWEKDGVYPFSHDYGFGRVNAKAAVEMALTWKNLPNEREAPVIVTKEESIPIPEDDQGISLPITIDVEQDMLIEFIEITFKANHPRWCDLEIMLTSPYQPKSTTSILTEQHTFCKENKILGISIGRVDDKYGYNGTGWRFGSVRHFGEHSKGTWTLTIKDKRSGKTGTFKSVELKIYGTELPPFVQAVQVKTPDKTFYHAGWTAIQDAAQLVWTWFQESLPVVVGTPVTLQVTASAPMKEMRVEAAGQTYQLAAVPESDNTIWETTLPQDVSESELPLTIRGKDTNGTPLLPFADTAPKAYPLANSTPSDAGDTVHKLTAQLPIYTWKLTTPGKSVCFEAYGGIVCELGASEQGDPASSTTGRVKLRPKTAALQAVGSQSLLLEDDSASRAEHAGIHFLPAGEIAFIIEPGAQELELCQAETKRNDCISMPSPESNTKIVSWRIEKTAREHENLCQVTVRLDAAAYLLEIQSSTLCESVRERSGTFDASAECGWSVAFSYDLEPRGTVIKQLALGEIRPVRQYEGCDYYTYYGNVAGYNNPAECRLLNKSWEKRGKIVVQGGRSLYEDVGTPYVSVPIETRLTCDWQPIAIFLTGVAPDGSVEKIPLSVTLKGQGGGGQQVYGLRTNCVEETAYQRYRPLVECTYKMEATRLQLASGQNNITIPLHPGEPDATP